MAAGNYLGVINPGRVPTLLRQVLLEEGTTGLSFEMRSGSFVKWITGAGRSGERAAFPANVGLKT